MKLFHRWSYFFLEGAVLQARGVDRAELAEGASRPSSSNVAENGISPSCGLGHGRDMIDEDGVGQKNIECCRHREVHILNGKERLNNREMFFRPWRRMEWALNPPGVNSSATCLRTKPAPHGMTATKGSSGQ